MSISVIYKIYLQEWKCEDKMVGSNEKDEKSEDVEVRDVDEEIKHEAGKFSYF